MVPRKPTGEMGVLSIKSSSSRLLLLGLVLIAGLVLYWKHRTREGTPDDPNYKVIGGRPVTVNKAYHAARNAARDTSTPLQERAVLVLEFDGERKGDALSVAGRTNLPDGTRLEISLRPKEVPYLFHRRSEIRDGRCRVAPFDPEGGLPPGLFVLRAMVLLPKEQPEEVRTVIGERGEHLKGGQVSRYNQWTGAKRMPDGTVKSHYRDKGDATIEAEERVFVGASQGAARKAMEPKRHGGQALAREVFEDLQTLAMLATLPASRCSARESHEPPYDPDELEALAWRAVSLERRARAVELPLGGRLMEKAARDLARCFSCHGKGSIAARDEAAGRLGEISGLLAAAAGGPPEP